MQDFTSEFSKIFWGWYPGGPDPHSRRDQRPPPTPNTQPKPWSEWSPSTNTCWSAIQQLLHLPIHLLHKQKILELVHTALFHTTTLPDVYHNYFVINRDVHSHDTMLIRCVKKSSNMKSVQYSGSALWNCLPLMRKEPMSKKSFKNKVKLHLLSEMSAA